MQSYPIRALCLVDVNVAAVIAISTSEVNGVTVKIKFRRKKCKIPIRVVTTQRKTSVGRRGSPHLAKRSLSLAFEKMAKRNKTIL